MALKRLSFIVAAVLLWLPTMLVLRLSVPMLASAHVTLPVLAKQADLGSAYPLFGELYALLSVPCAWFLWSRRPRSRLRALGWAAPFSMFIPLIAILLLLPTWYFGFYAVAFTLLTWNAGPILWAILVAELRWRACSRDGAPRVDETTVSQ